MSQDRDRADRPKLNEVWHTAHPMPARLTLEQRIEWHLEHQANCACRGIPAGLLAQMKSRGIEASGF